MARSVSGMRVPTVLLSVLVVLLVIGTVLVVMAAGAHALAELRQAIP